LVQDFEKPKNFLHFDPYGGSETGLSEDAAADAEIAALRYEDKFKLRASIVLSTYHKDMEQIDFDKLSFEDKERHQRVTGLLNYLKGVKIIDAPVLLKIYNLHRCTL